MPMVPFFQLFPELGPRETRSLLVRGLPDLPDGDYGFIEFYCNELGCDCRRVILRVVTAATQDRIWATINYGWETSSFYRKWSRIDDRDRGAWLDPINPQSPYAPALLRTFREFLLKDPAYVERLKRHYQLFKSAIKNETAGRFG